MTFNNRSRLPDNKVRSHENTLCQIRPSRHSVSPISSALRHKRPPLPEGYLEKLQQVRYSDHTVRVYTSYFRDFQQYFEGRKIETVTPGEINDYLLYLIHEKNISSCQQNQRINAIKFYYEKVLGQERRCYKVNRAKREKTLPDVLSKEEIKKILDATVTDLRFFCMFSILYSAGLRISELLELKPGDINESRSLIRVRQEDMFFSWMRYSR